MNAADLTFAEQTRIIAKRQGLKLTELANRIGITRQALNTWLSKEDIGSDKMKRIADALNCDLVIQLVPCDGNTQKGSDKV